ncbi:MAG: hypothetical protein LAT63_10600 [Marinobacter sp.]|nr:hypothetical protein [Marinobacter sp.]
MPTLHDKFKRNNGELIRADDWNDMLKEVDGLIKGVEDSLTIQINALDTRLETLENQVEGMVEITEEAKKIHTALRSRFYRLDLATEHSTFAIGQRGTITATIMGLTDDQTLDLSNPATRPWIDFVTVWGNLKAAPGFTSRGGAGDQTISVQVNAQGVAQVLIRSDHAENFAEEEEQEISNFLSTRPVANNNRSIADFMLQAATPQDAVLNNAYLAINQAYDRQQTSAPVLQKYVDTYYLQKPARVATTFTPSFINRWRDYRATVMAFLKPDSSPITADGALATASIQVTFRDWIGPWYHLGYLAVLPTITPPLADRFRNLIDAEVSTSVSRAVKEVNDSLVGKGVLGQQRYLIAVNEAMGSLQFATTPPPATKEVVQAIRYGSQMQTSMLYAQYMSPGAETKAAGFEITAESSSRANAEAGKVKEELTRAVDTKLTEASNSLKTEVQRDQVAFKTELMAEDGPILGVTQKLVEFDTRVKALDDTVKSKADVALISGVLGALPR